MRRAALLALVVGFVGIADAQEAADPIVVTMADLLPHLDRYRALPPEDRDLFALTYCVDGGMIDLEAVVLRYRAGDEEGALGLDDRGCVDPLPSPALYDRNPLVIINQARGEAEMIVHITPQAPLGEAVDARLLRNAAGQASRALRERAGPLALLLPGFGGVAFQWDGPAPLDAFAELENGERVDLPAVYDTVYYRPVLDRRLRDAETLRFGVPPARASLIP